MVNDECCSCVDLGKKMVEDKRERHSPAQGVERNLPSQNSTLAATRFDALVLGLSSASDRDDHGFCRISGGRPLGFERCAPLQLASCDRLYVYGNVTTLIQL